ncbi:MAG: EpsI family protein [Fimbriimonadaceae bacterium]|nr:EpsI family protein [Chthonomonadaceae bacterium]MCO5295572.1 EpsI family protein [Fimbriimonadaceae bacterium]
MRLFASLPLRTLLACLVLAPAGVVALRTTLGDSHPPRMRVDTLPEVVGEWVGVDAPLTDRELSILQSPVASQRMYTAPNGDTVQVLLVQVDNTQNAHDPRLCMDGSGYTETSTFEEAAPWSWSGSRNRVSHSVFSRDGRDREMDYWLATPNGNVPNMSAGLKLEGLKRALRGESTQGIAVRLLTHPNAYDPSVMTSPARARELWAQIDRQVGFERLVRGSEH